MNETDLTEQLTGTAGPTRILPNGDRLDVLPMIPGNGRLTITLASNPYPRLTYDGCWCYASVGQALAAQAEWDGTGDPPVGWHREPMRPYRRRTNGDPNQEYIAP